MILVIDNYDSFTYNLVQYLGEMQARLEVRRNDQISIGQIDQLHPERILISPGPCSPRESGLSNDVIRTFGPRLPLLGVCLGHQCIGQVYGGRVVAAPELMHGKTSPISHTGVGVFAGMPNPFDATRYHSLVVERDSLPDALEITAETSDGVIMGLRHRDWAVEGLQFHPESVLTDVGPALLANFLAALGTPRP